MEIKRIAGLLFRVTAEFVAAVSPLVFWQSFFDPFGPAQLSIIRIFVPFLCVLYFIKVYAEKKPAFYFNPALPAMAAYVAANFLSVFGTFNKGIGFKFAYEIMLYVIVSYIIVSGSARHERHKIAAIMMTTGTLMSLYGIIQRFGVDPFSWNTDFSGRPMGTIGNPDFFAGHLLIPIFLLAGYTLKPGRFRLLALAGLAVNILCLFYTKVLGAYLGFITGTAVFTAIAAFTNRETILANRKKVLKILVAAVLVSAAVLPFVYGKASDFIKSKKRSMVHRLLMWEASLLMVKDAPILGMGAGNYRLYYPKYQAKLLNDPANKEYDYVVTWMPHQNYLLIAAETGLTGLGLFLAALVVFFAAAAKRLLKAGACTYYMTGAVSAVSALLGASFFNTFYNVPATTLYFFILLFSVSQPVAARALLTGRNAAAAGAIVSSLFFLYSANGDARTLVSNYLLKKAVNTAKTGNHGSAIGIYERIIGLKPVELCPQMDVAHFYYAAESLRESGNNVKAAEYYKKDLEINPFCPEVNNMLGAVLGQSGDINSAVEKLKMAVYLAPHYEAAYINLATAFISKGEYRNARLIIEKYIEINGSNDRFASMLETVRRIEEAK